MSEITGKILKSIFLKPPPGPTATPMTEPPAAALPESNTFSDFDGPTIRPSTP